MAGTRLFAQSVLFIMTAVMLLVGFNMTGIDRHFVGFKQPDLPLIGGGIFTGIDSISVYTDEATMSISTACSQRDSDRGSYICAIDNGTRTMWTDSERRGAHWVLRHPPKIANILLNDLLKQQLQFYGCENSSCNSDSDILSSGFSQLKINLVLAVEKYDMFKTSRQGVETAAFLLQDALRVFEDAFLIDIDLRVVRNVNWKPFMRTEYVAHDQGVNGADRETVRVLSTETMMVPRRGGPGIFPLDELTAGSVDSEESDGCGVACRTIHLIVYQPERSDVSVIFEDSSLNQHSINADALVKGEQTSMLVDRDIGISIMRSPSGLANNASCSGDGLTVGAVLSSVLLDQLRAMLGVSSSYTDVLHRTDLSKRQKKQNLPSAPPVLRRSPDSGMTDQQAVLQTGRELLVCPSHQSRGTSGATLHEMLPEVISDARALSSVSGRICPLVCYWESRALIAASALHMHRQAVDTLQGILQLHGEADYYLGPSARTRAAFQDAVEQVHLAVACREHISTEKRTCVTGYTGTDDRCDGDGGDSRRSARGESGWASGKKSDMDALLSCVMVHSTSALRQAHAIYYDPTMTQDVRARDDFLIAILLPYWMPVLIPLLFGMYVEIKRYIAKHRKYVSPHH